MNQKNTELYALVHWNPGRFRSGESNLWTQVRLSPDTASVSYSLWPVAGAGEGSALCYTKPSGDWLPLWAQSEVTWNNSHGFGLHFAWNWLFSQIFCHSVRCVLLALYTMEGRALRTCSLPSAQAGLAADSHGWKGREELKPSSSFFTYLSIRHRLAIRKKRCCDVPSSTEVIAWKENNPDFRVSLSTLKWFRWSHDGFKPGAGKSQMHHLRATQSSVFTAPQLIAEARLHSRGMASETKARSPGEGHLGWLAWYSEWNKVLI